MSYFSASILTVLVATLTHFLLTQVSISPVVSDKNVIISIFLGILTFLFLIYERTVESKGKAVLITGCDTGFGNTTACALSKMGFWVIAGCLNDKSKGAEELKTHANIVVIEMNVTKDDHVTRAVEIVKKTLMQHDLILWAIINNAGYNYCGDSEFSTMEKYKFVLDVNLLGPIRVTKAFLPFLRACKGRIINVTSVKGRIAFPFCAPYNVSKFGLEGFSDSLRMDLWHFGVKVIIIEPGDYGGSTGMLGMGGVERIEGEIETLWDAASEEMKQSYGRSYWELFPPALKTAVTEARMNTAPVIDAMVNAVHHKNPKYRYLMDGGVNYFDAYCWCARLRDYLPYAWTDLLMYWRCGLPKPRPET